MRVVDVAQVIAPAGLPDILWRSHIWGKGSVAGVARAIVLALDRAGAHVSVENTSPHKQRCEVLSDEGIHKRLSDLVGRRYDLDHSVSIRFGRPEGHEPRQFHDDMWDLTLPGRHRITYVPCAYGFSQGAPDPSLINAHFDQVWAISRYVADTLVDMGVAPEKIRIVHHGYDPSIFSPQGPVMPLATQKRFRFVNINTGCFLALKGIDVLVQSYVTAFDRDDDVSLVLHMRKDYMVPQIREYIAKTKAAYGRDPEILMLEGAVNQEAMASLLRACQVTVLPGRCEGFGLPALEGMACGLPAIVSDYGGFRDFCHPEYTTLIPCEEVPVPPKSVEELISPFLKRWGNPSVAYLRKAMRRAYEAQDLTQGQRAAKAMEAWTWDRVAGQIMEALMLAHL